MRNLEELHLCPNRRKFDTTDRLLQQRSDLKPSSRSGIKLYKLMNGIVNADERTLEKSEKSPNSRNGVNIKS